MASEWQNHSVALSVSTHFVTVSISFTCCRYRQNQLATNGPGRPLFDFNYSQTLPEASIEAAVEFDQTERQESFVRSVAEGFIHFKEKGQLI